MVTEIRLRTDQINKTTLEISQEDEEVYTDLAALGDELPGHSPRYILLSYPMTLVRGFYQTLFRGLSVHRPRGEFLSHTFLYIISQ